MFARVYGKPCSACHTVFPQLNPAGEAFRARGLHGIPPVVKPINVAPGFDLPGTLPVASSIGVGEDITSFKTTGREGSTLSHFNLSYLALLAGGELGPYMAALFDYSPLRANTRTGELIENKRMGMGFLQAHADVGDWLVNLRGGLFELPLGTSPRVHRLSVQSYLLYLSVRVVTSSAFSGASSTLLHSPTGSTAYRRPTLVSPASSIRTESSSPASARQNCCRRR